MLYHVVLMKYVLRYFLCCLCGDALSISLSILLIVPPVRYEWSGLLVGLYGDG